ncbi:fimbrial protein [Kluyvera sichuanensis]|uniref:fimbrial protein n=1 Tax=Kluyvera sichuanensis TaxID=2725494 RepID=UPI0039F6CB26
MKNLTVKGLTLALMMVGGSAMAMGGSSEATGPTTVTGGSVHFTGSVVNAACAVAQDSVNKTVDMGQVRLAAFGEQPTVGTAANQKTPFSITLTDCDTQVSTQATVTFNGAAAKDSAGVLDNMAGAGGAQGVGVQIYDTDGTALDLGKESKAATLIDGDNVMSFSADYITTASTLTAGNVDATATFNVTYQ